MYVRASPLALLAQDEHENWLLDTSSARKGLEDEAAQALEGGNAAELGGDGAAVVDLPSPLVVPLTASLEDLRAERRASMSHSTRIQVEALVGDRELDLEAVRSAVSQADARRRGDRDALAAATSDGDATSSSCSPSLAAAMKNLEAECPALSVVDWAASALFSFCGDLRAPDDRWTAACLQLERQIAGWVTRMGEDHTAAPCNSRRTRAGGSGRGREERGGSGRGRSATALATPPAEGDTVWEALETFQLDAGDVVDDRHCSAEATTREIDAEAAQRVHAWIGDIENAAADLCAAERASYLETVEALRAFDRLFGLEEDCANSRSADRIRKAVRAAADALTKGLLPTSEDHTLASEGGCLREEVRQAVRDVCHQDRAVLSVHEPRHVPVAQPRGSDKNQQGAPPSQGLGSIEGEAGSSGRGNDSAEALSNPTSRGAEQSVDADSGRGEGGQGSVALSTAIWRCRLTHIYRLRGVVMRLVRAVRGCEAKVASMRAALRRLKRGRVQLEHEGFSVAASMVRRALEECDHEIIEDILENGIPVCRSAVLW